MQVPVSSPQTRLTQVYTGTRYINQPHQQLTTTNSSQKSSSTPRGAGIYKGTTRSNSPRRKHHLPPYFLRSPQQKEKFPGEGGVELRMVHQNPFLSLLNLGILCPQGQLVETVPPPLLKKKGAQEMFETALAPRSDQKAPFSHISCNNKNSKSVASIGGERGAGTYLSATSRLCSTE